jgi:hypothetical protein
MNMAVLQLFLPLQPAAPQLPAILPKKIESELGIEKLCIHCLEYWPLDDEFWPLTGTGSKGQRLYSSACRACYPQRYKRGRYKLQPESGVQS